ncbi:Alanyl-tRNA editing protein Aarsd1 [Clydaea vesicula]|uniref:Alanyl-tRNA editing protein Aarsd1 n=1 Tax=Clydaea vesicula TaxID=447962 RepID=A0AAD5TX06_9FUNG|nr:Alanyl-tRNA editing protein Aarsd1 [Clydaea vesicula]
MVNTIKVGDLKCQHDPYLKDFEATVVSVLPNNILVLNDTILFPEGGGQPYDTGSITANDITVKVTKVLRKGFIAHHFLEKELVGIQPGDQVHVKLDWNRRYDHMQQHTGQHLISALVKANFGWDTVSWHLGSDISTLDLNTKSITTEELQIIEDKVNENIQKALLINLHLVNKNENETFRPSGKEVPEELREGTIRMIEIESVDKNVCCGTHLSNTSELKFLKFSLVEKCKGHVRLNFIIGNRILSQLSELLAREKALTNILQTNPSSHAKIATGLISTSKQSLKSIKSYHQEIAYFLSESMYNFIKKEMESKNNNNGDWKILRLPNEDTIKLKNQESNSNLNVGSFEKNYKEEGVFSICSNDLSYLEKEAKSLSEIVDGKGAKLNAGNDMSLKMSAKFGHLNLTKFLLINGADPNAKVVLKKNWYNYFFSTRLYKLGGTLLNDDDNVDLNIGSSNLVGRINETRNNQTETNSPNVESFSNTPTSPTSNFNAPLLPNSETVSTANPQHNHILEASVLNKKKKVCQVDLLLQAVQGNHVHLVEILITPTKKNNSFDNNTVQIPIRTSSLSPTSSPTRIVNTEGSTSLSINIGHNEFSQDSQRVSSDTLQTALADAFLHNRLHMAKMLIKVGGAKSNSKMINNLLQKAGAWRLGCGVREKYTKLLVLCIQALTEETFQRLQHSIVRAVSEIGSVGALKASLERGGDINCWDGLPIYSAVYSGILGIYGGGIIVTSDPSDPNAGTSVSVAELSTMAVPAIAALVVMYRLVPFHRLLYSLILVCKEQSKRNRDRWLRLESPVPMNEVVVH